MDSERREMSPEDLDDDVYNNSVMPRSQNVLEQVCQAIVGRFGTPEEKQELAQRLNQDRLSGDN